MKPGFTSGLRVGPASRAFSQPFRSSLTHQCFWVLLCWPKWLHWKVFPGESKPLSAYGRVLCAQTGVGPEALAAVARLILGGPSPLGARTRVPRPGGLPGRGWWGWPGSFALEPRRGLVGLGRWPVFRRLLSPRPAFQGTPPGWEHRAGDVTSSLGAHRLQTMLW